MDDKKDDYEVDNLEKASDWIKENLSNIFLVVLILVYILYGLFEIGKKDKTWEEILASISISLFVGLLIYSTLRSKGITLGRKNKRFVSSEELYAEEKGKASPNLAYLSAFCNMKTAQELDDKKRDIISSSGLRYELYCKGFYKGREDVLHLTEEQKEAIVYADKCKIEPLKSNQLLSDLPDDKKNRYGRWGKNEKQYISSNFVKDAFFMVGTSIVSGMFCLSPIANGDYAQALWNALQVLIWLSMGTNKMVQSKEFMINEYRQTHIIQKTEYLKEFNSTMISNPEIIKRYDYQTIYEEREKENEELRLRLQEMEIQELKSQETESKEMESVNNETCIKNKLSYE